MSDIVGAIIGADSASDAAETQARATNNATKLQREMWQQTQADNAPALAARNQAINQLQALFGIGGNTGAAGYGSLTKQFTGADLANDPGYQFTRDQGLAGIQNTAAARGGLYSGATLKALNKFNSGLADQTFNTAYNRDQQSKNQQANFLSNLAGLGSSISSGTQAVGQNYAANVGNLLTSNANAQGAAGIARGNIWGNALNSTVANSPLKQYSLGNLLGGMNSGNSWGNLAQQYFTGTGGMGD
jgi:hypothetical protein